MHWFSIEECVASSAPSKKKKEKENVINKDKIGIKFKENQK
jgi:hypothetical protein